MKKLLLIIILIIVIIGVFLLWYSPVIFQEGHPWPQLKGIIQLNFTNKDLVKLSSEKNKWLTKSKNGAAVIKSYMKDQGYDFTEQMGSAYFFQSATGAQIIATHRYYSRFYSLWTMIETINNTDDAEQLSIAEELADCLPKSDTASRDQCTTLLATIKNFTDCANAGFTIIQSDPLQCSTPDGRSFTDNTISSWNVAVASLNNCKVKSIFQAHSKLVILELKNGNKITAYEPQIDDVMKIAVDLTSKCGAIHMATE